MSRYVLRHIGSAPRQGGGAGLDVAEVVRRAGAKLLDEAPSMLLVECSARMLQKLSLLLPDWQAYPENVTPLPRVPRPAVSSPARSATRARRR